MMADQTEYQKRKEAIDKIGEGLPGTLDTTYQSDIAMATAALLGIVAWALLDIAESLDDPEAEEPTTPEWGPALEFER